MGGQIHPQHGTFQILEIKALPPGLLSLGTGQTSPKTVDGLLPAGRTGINRDYLGTRQSGEKQRAQQDEPDS